MEATDPLAEQATEELSQVPQGISLDDYRFVPWPGRFLVEVFPPETMTRGGLHLPDKCIEQKTWGRVIRVSKGVTVEPGTIIAFIDGAGTPMAALGDNFVLLEHRDDFECDILGTFIPKDAKADIS